MLTALLAVLALVFGVLTMAAPATAKDDPGKTPPGHSETFVPPGQDDVLPPGQDPDFVPPGQLDDDDDPTNDAKKVYICHADVNNGQGQPNLGQGGTGGQSGTGFNLLYISKAAASNAHFKLHPNDRYATDVEIAQGFCGKKTTEGGSLCYLPTLTEKTFTDITAADYLAAKADSVNYSAMPCPVRPTTAEVTYCVATGADTYARLLFTGTTGTDELTWLHEGTPLSAYTKVDPMLCVTPEEAAAIDAALAEPATVAPVLPGTIEEPEVVAVPAPATVPPLPATVPAGDGSGTPTVPTALLALLALGATALAASTVHLVRTTR